jgi:hypothetical protein
MYSPACKAVSEESPTAGNHKKQSEIRWEVENKDQLENEGGMNILLHQVYTALRGTLALLEFRIS